MEFVLLAQEMTNVWRCGTDIDTPPNLTQSTRIMRPLSLQYVISDGMFHEALLGSAKCRGDPGTRSCFRALRHRMRRYPPARRLKVSALGVAARGLVFHEELAH